MSFSDKLLYSPLWSQGSSPPWPAPGIAPCGGDSHLPIWVVVLDSKEQNQRERQRSWEQRCHLNMLLVSSCFFLIALLCLQKQQLHQPGTSKCLETARRKMERSLVPRRITLSEELRKVMSAPVRGAWAIAHIHGRRIKPARHPFGCPEDKHRDARFLEPRYRHRGGCSSQDGCRSPEQHDKRWVKAYSYKIGISLLFCASCRFSS